MKKTFFAALTALLLLPLLAFAQEPSHFFNQYLIVRPSADSDKVVKLEEGATVTFTGTIQKSMNIKNVAVAWHYNDAKLDCDANTDTAEPTLQCAVIAGGESNVYFETSYDVEGGDSHAKKSNEFTVETVGSVTTTDKEDIPKADYEDGVIQFFIGYQNPFPDTELDSLEGRAATELYRREVLGGYPDGEFKGARPVNRAEAAKFLLTSRFGAIEDVDFSARFSDIPSGQWFTKYILTAAEKGIINGYGDGTFKPADTVNTAEFLKMLTLTLDLETNLSHDYTDVPEGAWFEMYAGAAQKYNLFPERGWDRLEPAKEMSRREVAIAIYQYFNNRNR